MSLKDSIKTDRHISHYYQLYDLVILRIKISRKGKKTRAYMSVKCPAAALIQGVGWGWGQCPFEVLSQDSPESALLKILGPFLELLKQNVSGLRIYTMYFEDPSKEVVSWSVTNKKSSVCRTEQTEFSCVNTIL